ncbi:Alpha/Beta hydrolase protein [Epithele typhae]|uniref:Alpha/Beta hydrolase protein n=1 Tax=Epithele typhae TaxID=378194 RepID=UPI0020078BA0|nr:Alpha/Beta hydrolase protein [Epithele typhae]KAH9945361.1 Alpha/Beta hydrolase protein [Epithele typhae]
MDPEFAAAVEATKANAHPAPAGIPTPAQIRALYDSACTVDHAAFHEKLLPQDSAYTLRDNVVAVEGGEVLVRCITPASEGGQVMFPLYFNMHGGGGCVGSITNDDFMLRRLSGDFRMVTVNVEYRLAPKHKFPIGFSDCFAALKWVVVNAPSIGADLSKGFLIGGHSAGARTAACLAHEARDDPFFKDTTLTGQLLRDPAVIVSPSVLPEKYKPVYKSFEENAMNPPLSRPVIENLRRMYNSPGDEHDPRAGALLYPSHEGLPPAYIQCMGVDILRDDSIIYEMALREAGVKTHLTLIPGVGHGFYYNYPHISLAEKAREDMRNGFKWLLGRDGA